MFPLGDGLGVMFRDITEHKRAVETERALRQNRELTQLIQKHVEEERRSLARELHDELGQCVTAIKTIGASIAMPRSSRKVTRRAAADSGSFSAGQETEQARCRRLRP